VKFRLKRLDQFCGGKASFYTVLINESELLFERFIKEYQKSYQMELLSIASRINTMKNETGALDSFFRLDESSDWNIKKVVALNDKPEACLRLYGVKLSNKLVVLGSGGPKPKGIIRWQQNTKLSREAHLFEGISEYIHTRMERGQLRISEDGLNFIGNLELN
jgi:hypothetical protein